MRKFKNLIFFFSLFLALLNGISIPVIAQNNKEENTSKEAVVYVTKTGSKYHSANCGYLHSSSIEISLSDAQQQGYTACSRCNGSPSYVPKSKQSNSSSSGNRSITSVQCSGTTKAGNRCKRMTTDPSGRCYQH